MLADRHRAVNMEPPMSSTPPEVGSIHQGTVHTIRPFGVFVAIPGYRRHVMVHHSQLSEEIKFERADDDETKVKAMDFFFPKGTPVYVKVTSAEPGGQNGEVRVSGSIRAVSQEDGKDLDVTGQLTRGPGGAGPLQDEPPEFGSVLRATVKRVEAYGIFVQMEGFRRQGLVHASQVSNYLSFTREDSDETKKAELASVVAVGESIWVKVVEVGEDDGSGRGPKIGCSIKLVEQTSGEDLDPTGLRYKPRGEGGGGGRGAAAPLGASAGAVGTGGKIDWGHLAGDNKLYVGDHKGEYSLLDDDAPARNGAQRNLPPPPPLPGPPPHAGLPLPPPPPGPRTVEEALAIIEQYNKAKKEKKNKKKSKKEKKDKKSKKDKKKKTSKERKRESKGSPAGSSSSSSGSESDGDPLLDN